MSRQPTKSNPGQWSRPTTVGRAGQAGAPASENLVLSPSLEAQVEAYTQATDDRQRQRRRRSLGKLALLGIFLGIGFLLWSALLVTPTPHDIAKSVTSHGTQGMPSKLEVAFDALTNLEFLHEFIRDIGVAFLVAVFAVCGHELVREVTQVDVEWYHLRTVSRQMQVSTEAMTGVTNREADKTIPELLNARFPPALAKTLNDVVDSLGKLSDVCGPAEGSVIDAMTRLLRKGVTVNAQELARFRGGDDECTFDAPDSRDVVSWLLMSEMARLTSPQDSYDSVANLFFYGTERMLEYQTQALEQAFAAGVRVRRIFNLSGLEEDPYFAKSKFRDAQSIVGRHLTLTKQFPLLYFVRFLGGEVFAQNVLPGAARFDKEAAANDHLKRADSAFFGIYHRSARVDAAGCLLDAVQSTLAVSLHSRTLSPLKLHKVDSNSVSSRAFDILWNEWAVTDNPFEGEEFCKKLLTKVSRHASS